MHPEEIWYGTSFSAILARTALLPLSALYSLGWQTYLGLYNLGLKRASEPHKPVIVVGNLSVGGSGKTPVTLCLAKLLLSMGRRVVIGCSGYGSPRSEAATLAPAGPLDPAEWGDEPAMIRWLLPEVPLVVGRRRVMAAELVHEAYPGSVLLMDDGFQHLPLKKHVSLLVEADEAVSQLCLPAGPNREPARNRRRADKVIWTDVVGLRGCSPRVIRLPHRFVTPELVEVQLSRATALCALGQPRRFLGELKRELELVNPLVLPDHDPLTSGTLLQRLPPDLPVVVTAKDWVKLRHRADVGSRQFVIALQEVQIELE
ncbi:MAG: tetraacyldisaccharide 4'-kinase, partial [Fimbriimonas sp.]